MKNVLITGAAGGLGVCLVREYLGRGCRVFGTDIARRRVKDGDLFVTYAGEAYPW